MKKRNKSLIILIVVFVLITAAGSIYTLGIQQKDLDVKDQKLIKLRANYSSIETLQVQLKKAEEKVAVVDSLFFRENLLFLRIYSNPTSSILLIHTAAIIPFIHLQTQNL